MKNDGKKIDIICWQRKLDYFENDLWLKVVIFAKYGKGSGNRKLLYFHKGSLSTRNIDRFYGFCISNYLLAWSIYKTLNDCKLQLVLSQSKWLCEISSEKLEMSFDKNYVMFQNHVGTFVDRNFFKPQCSRLSPGRELLSEGEEDVELVHNFLFVIMYYYCCWWCLLNPSFSLKFPSKQSDDFFRGLRKGSELFCLFVWWGDIFLSRPMQQLMKFRLWNWLSSSFYN